MEKQIFDPPIPYVGSIYERNFSPGKLIRIKGLVPGTAYRFDINLQCGWKTVPSSDVAMQISVRLLDDYISLNSLQNGVWGEEQCGVLTVKHRENFEILLLCDFNQYKVAINGRHYCEFPMRIHYDRVTHLAIDGDVSISQISYESTSKVETQVASASAFTSITVPLLQNGGDHFEIINTATVGQNLETKHFSSSSEFAEPPSYEASFHTSSRPSYPTNKPTGAPGTLGASAYPRQMDNGQVFNGPVIPPPPPGLFNVRPATPYSTKKKILIGCGVVLSVLLVVAVKFLIAYIEA